VIFLIVLPFLGVLIYLIANGSGMSRRQVEQTQAAQQQFDSYVQSVAATGGGGATELAKAKELLDSGAINQDEYDKLKAKVLA
jgi:membrane protease subunit (stomatin/prohibitin family)